MTTVCILGEGAWGTSIATLLAHNGLKIKLWCYDPAVAQTIKKTRFNERYLPNIYLDPAIEPHTYLKEALENVEIIFEAIPVKFLRSVVEQGKPFVSKKCLWVILSKGIEQNTLLFPTEIVENVLGYELKKAVLVGPSFAREVAEKKITAVTLAAQDCEVGLFLQSLLANEYFRPYLSLDLIGVQVGAALKNVIALAIGMLDGAGFSENAAAFIFARGFHEIVQIAQALGSKADTLYGLSGIGDLVLTAMGSMSKNREVGKRLGQGESLESILHKTGYIPEGINTVQAVYQIMLKKNLDLPVCQGIYEIIKQQKTISEFLEELMTRPLEQECRN
jgi:glycerol-3-phosphate dehydrogenase (NAD(P)+)